MKRALQPALLLALVFAAGGTSGWVALNTQDVNHSQPTRGAVTKPVTNAVNKGLAADTQYQVQLVSAKVEAAPTETAADSVRGEGVSSQQLYSLPQLRRAGVVNWKGYKFTYYSQKVLPGGGLRIPGRHVNADGYVCDGEGYIVLANSAPKGTTIPTPFGAPGKVYDRGTVGKHFDVYTS